MGMYNTASAFNGLGKASLKLDFETKEELNDYCARMLEASNPDDDGDEPEGGDRYLLHSVKGLNAPGDVYIITDTRSKAKKALDEIKALQKYEVQKFNKEALKDIEEGDPLLFEQLKSDLNTQPATTKKIEYPEPEEVKIFNEIFEAQAPIYKSSNKKIIEPLIKTYLSPDIWESWRTLNRFDGGSVPAGYQMEKDIELIADAIINNEIYKDGYIPFSKVQDAYTSYYYDVKTPKQEIENLQSNIKDASNIKDLKLILKKIKSRIDKIKNFQNKFLNGDYFKYEQLKSDLGNTGDRYELIDNRAKQRKNIDDLKEVSSKDITLKLIERKPIKSKYDNENFLKVDIWQDTDDNTFSIRIPFFAPETKTNAGYQGEIKKGYKGYDTYSNVIININQVKDLEEQYSNAWHKKYWTGYISKSYYQELKKEAINKHIAELNNRILDYSQYYKEGSQRDKYIANNKKQIKYIKDYYGLGKSANPLLYNNLDILEPNGYRPTYQILPSYDKFFAQSDHKTSFAGFGLDDTKELIADICRKHYKECAAIAQHLKADNLKQSCFNLWHWLHHNIRYEYDREGREEVRTPLRVWADRRRGVDCDCLSVFAWCVLKCMGYDPAFEIVAFNNKKQFSHIFINCNGVVVDRVWWIFNRRPPNVTSSELYKVNLLSNLGQLF